MNKLVCLDIIVIVYTSVIKKRGKNKLKDIHDITVTEPAQKCQTEKCELSKAESNLCSVS